MLTLNDGRSELWQWDTGRKLTVDADCTQVHFSNKVFGRSIDVGVIDGVASIPDILLQTDKELTAWAFVGTPENGYTKISKVLKVNKRNKPADYVFTPPEQTTLAEIKEKIEYLESIQDPDAIKDAVDEYLANNPIEIDETDPTVPTWAKQTTKPKYTAKDVGAVAAVNGITPDENGNVQIEVGSGGDVDLTGYATEQYVQGYAQPKGDYLTKVPAGYAKTEDIPTKPEDIGAQPKGEYLTVVPDGYATEEYVKNKIAEAELGGEEVDLSGYAKKSELPTKTSQLTNDSGFITKAPVESVNGKAGSVNLSASDVGARPDTWMPTAQEVGALPNTYVPPTQTAEQVGADPAGTAAEAVSEHNTDTEAHNDLRLEVKAINDRLTAFFDSDDQTLDELSEIVAYITSNKTLIDSITTGKVSVSDIVNNLTTNAANKPLSAAQGVVLKGLIDAVSNSLANYQPKGDYALKSQLPTVPTKVSAFENDKGYLTQHQDISGKLDATALPTAINTALAQAKASGEFDGKDGTSATHSWNGTVLTVTSASGASSADLKGTKGDKGDKGDSIKGDPGSDGVSPTVTVNKSGKVTTISITDANGTKTATINDGADGSPGSDGKDGKDYSFDPTVYGLPVLELTGDTSPIAVSKDNKVTLSYVYGDRSGTCTLKGQGATSYKNAQALVNAGKAGKFNYTINFDTAFEAKSGWGVQKKYCLKANFIDHSHSRNVVSAMLWGLIVKSRTTANANLSGLVNGGAVDGFSIVITLNGEFHGLYTFNIPKDGWMFGLVEDTTKTQAVLGANDHELATQFKGLLAGDESDFELEFVSDENNAGWVTTSLNRLIKSCIDSWGGDLDTTVAQYLDWDSAIDYYIWIVVCKGTDMVDKNYLLTTFDGTKWCFTAYDMDSTYGLNWDGSGLTRAASNINFEECATTHRVWELIKRFKTNALKARYAELRANILSETRICQYFENFAWAIPSPIAQEDVKLYPTVPGSFVNGIDQIGRWIRQRLEQCDKWINELPTQETPVAPEKPVEMVNQVPISTDTDGSIYNGTGYKDNARLSSSGGVSGSAQNGSVVTGFIPFKNTDVIRIKGAEWLDATTNHTGHYYFNLYGADRNLVAIGTNTKAGSMPSDDYATYSNQISIVYDEITGVTTFSIIDPTGVNGSFRLAAQNASFFRINVYGKGADLIVTVNQEIT